MWLSERYQKVALNGQTSDPVPVLSGVPPGSVLRPVLFLIFINDLPDNIRSSVRLSAVDCVLYKNIAKCYTVMVTRSNILQLLSASTNIGTDSVRQVPSTHYHR